MVKSTLPSDNFDEPLPHDPDFKGPTKSRSCTDVICLILFLVFVTCWIGVGIYAFTNGQPSTLLVPKDSAGSRCGIDSHVKDKKYLFFFDLTRCLDATVPFSGCKTTQVCVSRCPDSLYFSIGPTYRGDREFCNPYNANECPSWYLKSNVFQKRCIPNITIINEAILGNIQEVTTVKMSLDSIKTSINNIKLLAEAEEIGQNIVEDIMNYWTNILIGIALALLACIIYIALLRWFAAPMVWFAIIGIVVALSFGIYFTAKKYIDFIDAFNKEVYEEVKGHYKTKRDLWLSALIILSVILFLVLLMLIILRNRILLAIDLLEEGSRVISSVTASLLFPLFPWGFQLGVIAYTLSVALFLTCTGEAIYKTRYVNPDICPISKDNTDCDPDIFAKTLKNLSIVEQAACSNATCKFMHIENDASYKYLQTLNIFGFFWLAFFLSDLGHLVLASVFAQWYWTFNKRTLPFFAVTEALGRTIRYHLGTLAFGSLIIAITRVLKVIMEYLDEKMKQIDNLCVKYILCCLKCFWCVSLCASTCWLKHFIKIISKNAYIMCAVHGENFCTSAKGAFWLITRNITRVVVLHTVTDLLFFISKLLVTMGVGAVSYVFFATDLVWADNSNIHYAVVPVIIIMICTYLISSAFFSVYSMAVDTVFLCFLEDCERNDGSPDKPYYMSKNLMKIFGKKNNLG